MRRNLLISSWPGTGGTTLSLLLAKNLNYRLLRGTETFRYFAKEIASSDTGIEFVEIEPLLQSNFGPIYDKYIDLQLVSSEGLVIETDIGGFRLGMRSEYYSVFLIADSKVRMNRLAGDDREKDVDVLLKRERMLREEYKKLTGLDWLSKKDIKNHYNFVLDNTNKGIKSELELCYEKFTEEKIIDSQLYEKLVNKTDKDEDEYWKNGKDYYKRSLSQNGQLMEAVEVFKDLIELFPDDIYKLPKILLDVVKSAVN